MMATEGDQEDSIVLHCEAKKGTLYTFSYKKEFGAKRLTAACIGENRKADHNLHRQPFLFHGHEEPQSSDIQ